MLQPRSAAPLWFSRRLFRGALILTFLTPGVSLASRQAPSVAAAAARPAARQSIEPAPTYYRPVLVDGKVFPIARSNFLSIIEIHDNWHAVRLRLIDGKWLPIGVHEGIDITGEAGTPILSITYGHVENVGWTFYSGTRVGIRGNDGRYYFYAHLSSIGPGIAEGAHVVPGQMLGRLGNTGYGPPGHRDEFPPHLHFGLQVGERWIDPYSLLTSTYAGAVAADSRAQSELDRLAAAGKRSRWQRSADALYTTFGLDLGT